MSRGVCEIMFLQRGERLCYSKVQTYFLLHNELNISCVLLRDAVRYFR